MSEKEKKGARDISDLKLRLGLKRDGRGPAGQGAGAAQPAGQPGTVPAPPGAKPPGFVPPPPGMPAPAPTPQPVIDHGYESPLSATAQAAANTRAAKMAPFIYGGIGVVALIIGWILGGINYERGTVKRGLSSAKQLVEDVTAGREIVSNIKAAITKSKERGPGGASYKPMDRELNEEFAAMQLEVPEDFLVYHKYMYYLDPGLVADMLRFYGGLQVLITKMNAHIRQTNEDLKTFEEKQIVGYALMSRFGVLIHVPKPEDKAKNPNMTAVAEIVELGEFVCKDDSVSRGGCGDLASLKGFNTKNDPTAAGFQKKELAKDLPKEEQVLFMQPNAVWAALFNADKMVQVQAYLRRVREIDEATDALLELQQRIDKRLIAEKNRSAPFSI